MTTALILGCAVLPGGDPSPTFALRIDHGLSLYRAGRVSRICVTGGQGRHGPPEAHVARDRLRAQGVPAAHILVEDTSVSTFENLIFARPLLIGAPVIIVSSRWHLPRARLIAALVGVPATVSGPKGRASISDTVTAILREVAVTPSSIIRIVRWARRTAR